MVRKESRPSAIQHGRRFTDNSAGSTTTIAQELLIKGEIKGTGNIELMGAFEGVCDLNGRLSIRADGRVTGNVVADDIIIEGRLEGDAQARNKIELRANGKVTGDMAAPSIAIDDGGYFEGGITMTEAAGDVVSFKEKRILPDS